MTLDEEIQWLKSEIERLQAGRFTESEFQNLCHTAPVAEGLNRFTAGCAEFQRSLFGACDRDKLQAEIDRLHGLIHTPHTADFMTAVPLEAAFQIDHWGVEHDAGKEPQDYFWLLGYLAGKAMRHAIDGNTEKALHHTVSSAAVLLNWYRRMKGDDRLFQPGSNDLPATDD